MWTPYEIDVILHHHVTSDPHPVNHTLHYAGTIKKFLDIGLFERDENGVVRTTEMAHALIDMWLATPLPISKWVDPRFEEQA